MLSERIEEFRVDSDPSAVRAMRAAVRRMCRNADLPAEASDTAVLLTSETLTNAIVHAGHPTRMVVWVSSGGIRVEIADDNDRPPVLAAAGTDDTSGRGIRLVDTLATRWGVAQHRHGKTVWFEIVTELPAAARHHVA